MKLRREQREHVARLKARDAALQRSIASGTISVAEFAAIMHFSPSEVRYSIELGAIPTRMVGNRRRIRLTSQVVKSLLTSLEKEIRELESF